MGAEQTKKDAELAQARDECWSCEHKRAIPRNAHISCAKPDPQMTGHPYGIKMGWFIYPICFDPTWKTRKCANYTARGALA